MKFQGKVISAVVPSGQERPGRLTCFQSRKETANGRHRGVNEPGKDLALDAFPFLKTCLKIINLDDCCRATESPSELSESVTGLGTGFVMSPVT
jgi:hypothetical protein